jgi:hypothetical protein
LWVNPRALNYSSAEIRSEIKEVGRQEEMPLRTSVDKKLRLCYCSEWLRACLVTMDNSVCGSVSEGESEGYHTGKIQERLYWLIVSPVPLAALCMAEV